MAVKACEQCGTEFEAARSTAKFCSATCRSRKRRRPAADMAMAGVVDQVTRRLQQIKKLDSVIGQQCLVIARRMESGAETGSAIASLSKELSRVMATAEGTGVVEDPLDEIARRRAEKEARARKATR